MAQEIIGIGAAPNDGTGDPVRSAFGKCNDNFAELYAGVSGAGVPADNDTTMAANSPTVPPTQHAVIAYIAAQIAALVASAPGTLDTLNELAAALGDDPNYATTITTALAGKLGLGGGTLTGALLVPDDPYDATGWNGSDQVPTKNAVRDKIEAIVAGIPGTYTDEMAQDAVGALISAGTNTGMTITYNDAGNAESIAIDTTAEAERVRDTIGAALVQGGSITITVDDAGDTITITNVPLVQAVVSAATVTPAFGNDLVKITAQAAALTLANWSGTAIPAWGLGIRIKDDGTARAITFGTKYRAMGVTLPTTTVAGKTLYLGCVYNSDDDKIDVVAVAQQA